MASEPPSRRISVEEAARQLRAGRMIILVDDEDRENEGDLVQAAEHVTGESIHFMMRHGRGLICATLTEERTRQLGLTMMAGENTSPYGTAFTVSVDARGVRLGVSASDRALTIRSLLDESAGPDDFSSPGHVFPLRARDGGVLVRTGQTEGSVDLAKIAGLAPGAVICEVMKPDGTMARRPDLEEFADEHDLGIVTVADVIAYRMANERLVSRAAEAVLPTAHGEFRVVVYENAVDDHEHVALIKGEIDPERPTLVRLHSSCITGDVFHSLRCDCGEQLHEAMERIEEEGSGVLVYVHQEGRGIGLANKIRAYRLQETGKDTVEANEALGFNPDLRDYGLGAQILRDVGVRRMRLLTNNPGKVKGLEAYGLSVESRVPIEVAPNRLNERYLATKRSKLGHLLSDGLGALRADTKAEEAG